MKKLIITSILAISITACQKDEKTTTSTTGNIRVVLQHTVDGQALQLETGTYSQEGKQYIISRFDYYLSNFQLKNTNNTAFSEANSYHLVRTQRNTSTSNFEIKNVPVGTYNQLNFALGVDKARNTSIVQAGDLDPNNNMAWDWNTGYRFVVLEGKTKDNLGLVFHIGTDENYQTCSFKLPKNIEVIAGKTTKIQINTNVAELFRTPHTVNFLEMNDVMGGDNAKKISENYKDMFTVTVE
jgi:hypothetical protein